MIDYRLLINSLELNVVLDQVSLNDDLQDCIHMQSQLNQFYR